MTAEDLDSNDFGNWDPDLTGRLISAAAPLAKRWFRPRSAGCGVNPAHR